VKPTGQAIPEDRQGYNSQVIHDLERELMGPVERGYYQRAPRGLRSIITDLVRRIANQRAEIARLNKMQAVVDAARPVVRCVPSAGRRMCTYCAGELRGPFPGENHSHGCIWMALRRAVKEFEGQP
jgi:hypothetical protein